MSTGGPATEAATPQLPTSTVSTLAGQTTSTSARGRNNLTMYLLLQLRVGYVIFKNLNINLC